MVNLKLFKCKQFGQAVKMLCQVGTFDLSFYYEFPGHDVHTEDQMSSGSLNDIERKHLIKLFGVA